MTTGSFNDFLNSTEVMDYFVDDKCSEFGWYEEVPNPNMVEPSLATPLGKPIKETTPNG